MGRSYLVKALVGGAVVVIPIYLAGLLLLKAAKSLVNFVHPIAVLLPDWFPAANVLSILLVLMLCFLVGVAVHTPLGRSIRERIEKKLFERIPGYALLRSVSQRMANDSDSNTWKPALVEIENALVPAFIVEDIDATRCAVFVPSVPTPLAGAVYILERRRIHPLDVPFTQAIRTISRWGVGSTALVAAMRKADPKT